MNVPTLDLSPLFFFQESFTVTLGAQMKQMHNLRIVAANIMGKHHSLIQRMMPAFVLFLLLLTIFLNCTSVSRDVDLFCTP
jgi:hypothetical protein